MSPFPDGKWRGLRDWGGGHVFLLLASSLRAMQSAGCRDRRSWGVSPFWVICSLLHWREKLQSGDARATRKRDKNKKGRPDKSRRQGGRWAEKKKKKKLTRGRQSWCVKMCTGTPHCGSGVQVGDELQSPQPASFSPPPLLTALLSTELSHSGDEHDRKTKQACCFRWSDHSLWGRHQQRQFKSG